MGMVQRRSFGRLRDGREAELFTIAHPNGIRASFTNYGAAVVSVVVPDRQGKLQDVVLGYDCVEEYERQDRCAGATCGRYAGRIADGRFWLNGSLCQAAQNENRQHCLHGGFEGFDRKLWKAEVVGEQVKFSYVSVHGEEGFPGRLQVELVCGFGEDQELGLTYFGVSDRDTVVNLTNHIYWNLKGHGSGDVGGHRIRLDADYYVPCDGTPMPNGEIRMVEGTAMDLRSGRCLEDCWTGKAAQLACLGGLNHDYLLNRPERRLLFECGSVWEEESGRKMTLSTTEPAVHMFTANNLTRRQGKENAVYEVHGGFCMEPGFLSNSMRLLHFPSPVLKAGESYRQETRFRLSVG